MLWNWFCRRCCTDLRWFEFGPYPLIWSSYDLELGTAKFGHLVQNVGADLGFGFLVGKAARFQFGADDHLPAPHLCFTAAALIVSAAHLPGNTPACAYCGNALVAQRWIVRSLGAENRSLGRLLSDNHLGR
ncbi:hypothetical protein BD293_3814 [Roseinatronobacter monicus]|uniref:Uncharacterized protein n=1 Tax=Roseinatronobacter monicus TaxID=393481 RepID=A0A543K5T1_9RHOB|nr:hypothetical protein BD293_3814 [Roseinatronobacter monicus]